MRRYDDYLRWLYRGGRPNRLARLQNRASAIAFAAGIWPKRVAALEVWGRRSGRGISFPVVIADYEGERYLVAMLGGDANWVRNVRAAGGRAVLRHGRREAVRLEEVSADTRPAILRRYLAVAPGARPHLPVERDAPLEEFERIREAWWDRLAVVAAYRDRWGSPPTASSSPKAVSAPVRRRRRLGAGAAPLWGCH